MCPPILKFSLTVNSEKILLPSKTCAIPNSTMSEAFIFEISLSLNEIPPFVISPFCTSNKPVIERSTVVFPDPLLPKRATMSPSLTVKEIPLKTKITS